MPGEKIKSIILLSGPVGAGKSTVAGEMIKSSSGPVAFIEGDKFWTFIVKGHASKNRHNNFKMTMSAMTLAAVSYALYGYEVIVDFSIPPWFLESALKVVDVKKISLDYIILCPSQAVCAKRAASRSEGTISNYENYKELYSSFAGMEQHTISDDNSNAAELALLIRKGLSDGIFRIK